MKFLSMAAPEVVKMITSSAASDENFIKMMTPFCFNATGKFHVQPMKNLVACYVSDAIICGSLDFCSIL